MARLHGEGSWAVSLVSLLLIWSCIGAAFAGLLGYSRIPYGAARHGHFFGVFARVHPVHGIPHLCLFLVGGLTLFWSFFDLQNVIDALIVTRILEQFIGQAIGLMLLHARQPDRPWPYRMPWYPVPCVAALAGWVYLYACARPAVRVAGPLDIGGGHCRVSSLVSMVPRRFSKALEPLTKGVRYRCAKHPSGRSGKDT